VFPQNGILSQMSTSGTEQLVKIADASARDRILIAARRDLEIGMEETPDKVAALLDTACIIETIGSSYALIGGIAVGIHSGVPRATLDVDVAIASSIKRSDLIDRMTGAGFRLTGEFEHSVNFRHASGEPVQFAIDPTFDPLIERAEYMIVRETRVRIVRKDDLVEMKRRAAADPSRRKSKALRDQADVELLLGDVPDPDEGW
jgi:hypothetical protein